MIHPEDLFFTYRWNLSTKMKGSLLNFCFVVKLCVQMKQSVTRHLALRDFVIGKKLLTHVIFFKNYF